MVCSIAGASSLDELRGMGTPVVSAPAIIQAAPKQVLGDPASSLSKEEALKLAQLMACQVRGGFTAVNMDDVVDGHGLPVTGVYVCEPCKAPMVFDYVLVEAADGMVRVRQVVSRDSVNGGWSVRGSSNTPEAITAEMIKGRVIGTIFADPQRTGTGRLTGLLEEPTTKPAK